MSFQQPFTMQFITADGVSLLPHTIITSTPDYLRKDGQQIHMASASYGPIEMKQTQQALAQQQVVTAPGMFTQSLRDAGQQIRMHQIGGPITSGQLALPPHSIIIPATAQLLPTKVEPVKQEQQQQQQHQQQQQWQQQQQQQQQQGSAMAKCETSVQCGTCGKSFADATKLKRHSAVHSGDGSLQFECDICNKAFSSNYRLRRHSVTHSDAKPYECSTCHKCFSRSYSLTTHLKIHSGVKDHRCPYCDKAYSRSDHLKRHILHSHTPGGAPPSAPKPPSAKNFVCPVCQKAFSDSSHLRRHMRTHPGVAMEILAPPPSQVIGQQ